MRLYTPEQRARRNETARMRWLANKADADTRRAQTRKAGEKRKAVQKRAWALVLEAFNEKYGRECCECGHTGPYCHFEWAHIKRDGKVNNISSLCHSGQLTKLEKELPKCRLLCRLCHAEETAAESNWEHAFD